MTPSSTDGGPSVGLMLPTVADTDDDRVDAARVLDAARLAEAAGFDGVYVGDHLVHPRPLLESVVTLTTVAASTAHVALGFCVLLVALRPTVLLAKQLATLAAFAPGRLRIGVGVGGEYPPEFAIAGVPLAARGRRAETAVRGLRSLLAGRPTIVEGVDGVEIEVTIAPAAPGTVPVLFAGWSEPALRRAAQLGDGWIGYLLAPDSFERRRSRAARVPRRARDAGAVHDRDVAPGVARRRSARRGDARRDACGRASSPTRPRFRITCSSRDRRRRSSISSTTIGSGDATTWC